MIHSIKIVLNYFAIRELVLNSFLNCDSIFLKASQLSFGKPDLSRKGNKSNDSLKMGQAIALPLCSVTCSPRLSSTSRDSFVHFQLPCDSSAFSDHLWHVFAKVVFNLTWLFCPLPATVWLFRLFRSSLTTPLVLPASHITSHHNSIWDPQIFLSRRDGFATITKKTSL
jgi:hypothetical protein